MRLKTKNRRQRETAAQTISKGIVAEVYSPPRVAETAERLGLSPGMSFDFATHDEAGQLWNFAKKEMSDKANKPL